MTNKEQGENGPKRAANGTFLPGVCPNPKGRPKGSPNKATASLKAALEASFTELGGVHWLVQLAKSNPDAYVRLLLQILPKAAPESAEEGGGGDILDDPDPDV